ncbi:hypothetical protein A3Q56_05207 [Intoshia linei]|uniref:Fork-head domain-containing protein n=1 Tax=Intoshia linei TaxID=1819745 RepID=A0A177AYI8_9BILA|nr:hypothetical protein A3Q56_05207 [Intoshia linei]
MRLNKHQKNGQENSETDESLSNINWLAKSSISNMCLPLISNPLDTCNEETLYKRPNLSYMQIIWLALYTSKAGHMTLQSIYKWIENNYPFFKFMANQKMKNSIRHNLTVHTMFKKMKPKDIGYTGTSLWYLEKRTTPPNMPSEHLKRFKLDTLIVDKAPSVNRNFQMIANEVSRHERHHNSFKSNSLSNENSDTYTDTIDNTFFDDGQGSYINNRNLIFDKSTFDDDDINYFQTENYSNHSNSRNIYSNTNIISDNSFYVDNYGQNSLFENSMNLTEFNQDDLKKQLSNEYFLNEDDNCEINSNFLHDNNNKDSQLDIE